MELRQLEQFVAVAEERHFTRAARRLQLAQSGVSATVRALERELGLPLFIRSTRHLELTDAGSVLLTEARRLLDAARAARAAVEATRQVLRGTLRVGTVIVMGQMGEMEPGLAELLHRFRREHPAVEVHLSQRLSHELLQAVADGHLDIAFCGAATPTVPGVTTVALAAARLQLICAAGHPLSTRASVTLAELSSEPFVDPPRGSVLRRLIDEAFAAAGLDHESQFEVNDVHAYLEVVRRGSAVALFPGRPGRAPQDLSLVPLDPPGPPWQLIAAVPAAPKASAAALALLTMVTSAAEATHSDVGG